MAETLPNSQTCRGWVNAFSCLLESWKWPGDQKLNSEEFQTLKKWHELLDNFASLDLVSGKHERYSAYSLLKRLAGELIYQPRNERAPIQIMGFAEAAGMEFRQTWVVGLNDTVWPPASHANPFLPITLQQDKEMPHSSSDHELKYARMVTKRLAQSAPNVIFSAPLDVYGSNCKASALIASFRYIPHAKLIKMDEPLYAEVLQKKGAAHIERLYDDNAPPVTASKVRGGVGLFKDQAACPFRAFARHRLGACELSDPFFGPEAIDRGTLAHECLNTFWQQAVTHTRLCALNDDALHDIITASVADAIAQFSKDCPGKVTNLLLEIERKRLCTLLAEWLTKEKSRSEFEVAECERKHSVTVSGLTITTRVDRIDRLPDGSLVIIDYKISGQVGTNDWRDERLKEPQLPLYVIAQTQVAAVAFARLKRGKLGFVGLGNVDVAETVDGIKTDENWPATIKSWRQNLAQLANKFKAGHAAVDPRQPVRDTCKYCDLSALCRINEHRQ